MTKKVERRHDVYSSIPCRIAILLVLCLIPVLAAGDELKERLVKQYQSQVLAFRGPVNDEGQDFDSDGKPLGTLPTGAWALHSGLFFVEKLTLKKDGLELSGDSLSHFDARGRQTFQLGLPITIRIRLVQPLRSIDDAQNTIEKVFSVDKETLQKANPEYRRIGAPDEPIYQYGQYDSSGLTIPRAIFFPEPELSGQARNARYQGTNVLQIVVDKNGLVSRMQVVRHLGMGLDAQSLKIIKTWRFQPGVLHGQPVAVRLNIELSYKLF